MARKTLAQRFGTANASFIRTKQARAIRARGEARGFTDTIIKGQLTKARKRREREAAERPFHHTVRMNKEWKERRFRSRGALQSYLDRRKKDQGFWIVAHGTPKEAYPASVDDQTPDGMIWRTIVPLSRRDDITIPDTDDTMFVTIDTYSVRWRA